MTLSNWFASLAFLAFAAPSATAQPQPQLETSGLVIETADGAREFVVEVANDEDEIRIGLMAREILAANAGMLFDFGAPRPAGMWMRNTVLPLDMLFLDEDGRILMIARGAAPGSERSISPGVPVKAVLELNAGAAAELGIVPGDRAVHPIFGD